MQNLTNKQLVIVIAIIEKEGKFLLTRRVAKSHEAWHQKFNFPGGKIAPGETPLDALHREIKEETDLQIENPLLVGVYTHHWEIPTGIQQTFAIVYHATCSQVDIKLNPAENDDYIWETPEMIEKMDNLLAGTKEMLQIYYEYNKKLLTV